MARGTNSPRTFIDRSPVGEGSGDLLWGASGNDALPAVQFGEHGNALPAVQFGEHGAGLGLAFQDFHLV